MQKLLAALVISAGVVAGCGAIPGVTSSRTTAPAAGSPRASAAASLTAAPATATNPPAATAAPTTAPTAPPPPPPTAKPTAAIKAVPARAVRGSTFVLQFSGFPTSAQGIEIIQTVILPNGVRLAGSTFIARPDGTGFTTYLASLGDPVGQHVVQLAGGGMSATVILVVD